MLTEKIMEDAICNNPEKYLGEQGLKLISRQFRIGKYIFDLLFEDRHGAKVIVEVQKGTLDRTHTYKILDYYHEYKEQNPQEFIELMVIANSIPKERRKRLSDWGVDCKEIPESEFLEQSNIITQKSTEIHKNQTSQVVKLNPETIDNSTIFKDNFIKVLNKCGKDIQELFRYLERETDHYSAEKYTTNTPTYCIKKRYMFCEFTLLPNKGVIRIQLRVDNIHLTSNEINLMKIPGRSKKQKWIIFDIDNNTPKNEILRLIKEAYEFSE